MQKMVGFHTDSQFMHSDHPQTMVVVVTGSVAPF